MRYAVTCIAGAHRSGTSMLTRLLNHCSLALGPKSDLMPAGADNPEGFWENLRFVSLNDELLNSVGAAWDLPPWESESFAGPAVAPIGTKAELLLQDFAAETSWGWKDPRNCLTLPFWQRLLPELRTLIIVRNPLEVAYSMHRRNGTSHALALRLWEIYNRRLLENASASTHLITDYQRFFENPEAELRRITDFVGLPGTEIASAAAIVARGNRHTSFTTEALIDAGASEAIVSLYRSLIEAAKEPYGASSAILGPAERSAKRDRLAGTTSSLNQAVVRTETARRERAEVREAQIERLTQELSANAQRAALEIGRRDGRITELQAAYKHLDETLLHEQAWRNKIWEESNQMRDRLAHTNRLLHSYSVSLEEREQENLSLTERLRKQLQQTRRLVKLLDDVERAAEHLRTSRRWIIGNFVSWLGTRFSGRPLPGFGHLDKNVAKYRTWKKDSPEVSTLDDSIAALRYRQSPPLPSFPQAKAIQRAEPRAPLIPAAPSKPIRFVANDKVEVSIVIPVFNQLDYTQACLASIQEHAPEIPFEVIVVDDCSTDETGEVISPISGLIYLRNETNLGFIASCNRGAEAARGTYLLFLNNDTLVTPGWMENLYQTFEIEPEAGLVGSKLVYPDGRLQEAGAIIWRDATGWNRGKFQDPNKPEYNYLLEVDYCSAASVMLPKALFTSLGKFDSKYAPAYYEDTDLAFKVADSDHKVLYQPLSVVIHYEGITGGTDISSGTKKHQETNRATFLSRWVDQLASKPKNGDVTAWDAPAQSVKRILVIDHHLPTPDRDSGSLRMSQILTILRQLGHQVTFIPDNLGDLPPYGDDLRRRGIKVIHHPYINSIRDYLASEGASFDFVILSRCDFARKHIAPVRKYAPQARLIFDTVDLHFLREEREAELTGDQASYQSAVAKRQLEYDLIDEADETWVVSPAEQSLLQSARPAKSIQIVSNIVDIRDSPPPFSERRDMLFIGSFQHPPNVDAVLYFVAEILPLVHRQLPTINFYVIGDKPPSEIVALASERVIIAGYQPDVRLFFDTIRISIAPLRYGAGVKGKVNQSMGFGVPVVATSIAVEGMVLTNGEDVIIADDPEAFAMAVIALYESEDLWTRVSENGIAKTAARFSHEVARKQLCRLLDDNYIHSSNPGRFDNDNLVPGRRPEDSLHTGAAR